MFEPKSIYTKVAFEAIAQILKTGYVNKLKKDEIPEDLRMRRACFVSIHRQSGELRGCIGTIEPQLDNLYEEIISNAEAAATRDNRFKPLHESELSQIEVSVDVLTLPEKYEGPVNWDVQKTGVIVKGPIGQRGVLLPNLPGIDTAKDQLSKVMKKAGIRSGKTGSVEIYLFSSKRYH